MRKSTLPFFVSMFAAGGEGGGEPDDEALVENQVEGDDTDEDTDPGSDIDVDAGEEGDPADDEGADKLGDAGKKALDRMKAKLKVERQRRQALEAKYEPTEKPEVDIMARAHQKILRSEIKAAATGKLQDPADAYRFLDLEQFEVGDDGDVDEDDIAEAISSLIESKPYLAAQTPRARRFQGEGGNGVRKGSRPTQLTEADLERMSPEAVEKARKEGRFDKLLGISQ